MILNSPRSRRLSEGCFWSRADGRFIDFIASLQTAKVCLQ